MCPRLISVFLAATLVLAGLITHVGSVAHAASSDAGIAHEHVGQVEEVGPIDLVKPDTDDQSHTLGFCLDAQCCTPAVQMAAQDVVRHALESGKLAIAGTSNYALSIADSLLKPPRAIT